MRLRFFSIFSMIALLLCAISGATAAEIGKITFVDGRVDILKQGMELTVPVDVNAAVSPGDIIRTKSNSRAEITLTNGTIIRLAQGSRVGISGQGKVDLFRGKIRTISGSNASIEVLTPNAVANANGKDFYFIHEKGSSWFYSVKGSLQASNKEAADQSIFVEGDNCVRIATNLPMWNSCVYKIIDEQKHAWDTSTSEKVPVVAKLPSSGGVYAYTPLSGGVVDTPSLPVSIAFENLVCTQCPPLADIPIQAPASTDKVGYWVRDDNFCPVCQPDQFRGE